MPGPLEQLRVVELALAIQGPAAALHFANMGAEVIKVEPPYGDASRYHRGINNTLPEESPGSQFIAMNKGKRSVRLDIHTDVGSSVMHRLLATADVFITNYRGSALTRMGLDVFDLTSKYPRLVVGHANGFGPLGGDADKAMLDGAAQARGGIASLTGPAGGPPMPPGVAIADHAGAMQLALGCVTALVARGVTGKGQLVQTSSLGAQLWLQMWELQHSAVTGTPLTSEGPHHPNIRSPYGVYTTADDVSIIFIHAMTDEAWTSFWIFMEKPEVVLMDAWNTPAKRVGASGAEEGVAEIRALMREAFASKTFAELEAFLAGEPEIIWERVRNHADVLSDPQNIDNKYIVELDVPTVGTTRTVGSLMSFTATPTPPQQAPPALGSDTAAVMTDLGFGDADIKWMEAHNDEVRDELFAALLGEA